MAEPTDTQSRDWNSLPDVLLEQICSRMDLLSAVRLAACSVSLYLLLVYNLPDYKLIADVRSSQVAQTPT